MAIIEQCSKCGRDLGDCPYYEKENKSPCQYYKEPIDNSKFFSNFFSVKGRIGRLQYLVSVLIALTIYYVLAVYAIRWTGITIEQTHMDKISILNCLVAFIPAAALMIIAGIKRCHDAGTDWWFAVMPVILLWVVNVIIIVMGAVAFFWLFFRKSDEGVNRHGTEPLKPYRRQIQWQ